MLPSSAQYGMASPAPVEPGASAHGSAASGAAAAAHGYAGHAAAGDSYALGGSVTIGTQSDYRESEAQTLPYAPDYVIPEPSDKQRDLNAAHHTDGNPEAGAYTRPPFSST
jgi:hypothetical protein